MNDNTLLLRQVNPAWVQAGNITSQVFRPTATPEHAVIEFGPLNRSDIERKAKRLKLMAEVRGWLHAVA